jgi:hypothetical protein
MCMKFCKLPSNSITKMHVHNSGIIVADYTTNAVTVTTASAQRRNMCSSTMTTTLHSSWSPSSMSIHVKLCSGMSPAQVAVLYKSSTLQMHPLVLHWRLLPWGLRKWKITQTCLCLCKAMSTSYLRWCQQLEIRPNFPRGPGGLSLSNWVQNICCFILEFQAVIQP